jgi:hypothetical protein
VATRGTAEVPDLACLSTTSPAKAGTPAPHFSPCIAHHIPHHLRCFRFADALLIHRCNSFVGNGLRDHLNKAALPAYWESLVQNYSLACRFGRKTPGSGCGFRRSERHHIAVFCPICFSRVDPTELVLAGEGDWTATRACSAYQYPVFHPWLLWLSVGADRGACRANHFFLASYFSGIRLFSRSFPS